MFVITITGWLGTGEGKEGAGYREETRTHWKDTTIFSPLVLFEGTAEDVCLFSFRVADLFGLLNK